MARKPTKNELLGYHTASWPLLERGSPKPDVLRGWLQSERMMDPLSTAGGKQQNKFQTQTARLAANAEFVVVSWGRAGGLWDPRSVGVVDAKNMLNSTQEVCDFLDYLNPGSHPVHSLDLSSVPGSQGLLAIGDISGVVHVKNLNQEAESVTLGSSSPTLSPVDVFWNPSDASLLLTSSVVPASSPEALQEVLNIWDVNQPAQALHRISLPGQATDKGLLFPNWQVSGSLVAVSHGLNQLSVFDPRVSSSAAAITTTAISSKCFVNWLGKCDTHLFTVGSANPSCWALWDTRQFQAPIKGSVTAVDHATGPPLYLSHSGLLFMQNRQKKTLDLHRLRFQLPPKEDSLIYDRSTPKLTLEDSIQFRKDAGVPLACTLLGGPRQVQNYAANVVVATSAGYLQSFSFTTHTAVTFYPLYPRWDTAAKVSIWRSRVMVKELATPFSSRVAPLRYLPIVTRPSPVSAQTPSGSADSELNLTGLNDQTLEMIFNFFLELGKYQGVYQLCNLELVCHRFADKDSEGLTIGDRVAKMWWQELYFGIAPAHPWKKAVLFTDTLVTTSTDQSRSLDRLYRIAFSREYNNWWGYGGWKDWAYGMEDREEAVRDILKQEATVDMKRARDIISSCVTGEDRVIVSEDGQQWMEAKSLKPGMSVLTESGKLRRIAAVQTTDVFGERELVEVAEGVWLTTGHPVILEGSTEWQLPFEMGKCEKRAVDILYNFELEGGPGITDHSIVLLSTDERGTKVIACTLGKDCGKRIRERWPKQDRLFGTGYWSSSLTSSSLSSS